MKKSGLVQSEGKENDIGIQYISNKPYTCKKGLPNCSS